MSLEVGGGGSLFLKVCFVFFTVFVFSLDNQHGTAFVGAYSFYCLTYGRTSSKYTSTP